MPAAANRPSRRWHIPVPQHCPGWRLRWHARWTRPAVPARCPTLPPAQSAALIRRPLSPAPGAGSGIRRPAATPTTAPAGRGGPAGGPEIRHRGCPAPKSPAAQRCTPAQSRRTHSRGAAPVRRNSHHPTGRHNRRRWRTGRAGLAAAGRARPAQSSLRPGPFAPG